MEPVYHFRFVDRVYYQYPDETLSNIAIDFLRAFQSANFKGVNTTYYPKDGLFLSQKHAGGTCVKAKPGSVAIDFSKAITQGWAGTQIYDAETLIEEIFYRARKKGILYNDDIEIAHRLGDEIRSFIDKFNVSSALSADEIIYSSQQLCRDLRI